MPHEETTFANLTKEDIDIVPSLGYVITGFSHESSDDSIRLFLTNKWSDDTGNTMKIQTPTLKAGKKKVTVKWKKDINATGYQIRYSYDDQMYDDTVVDVSGSKTSRVIKGLKKGKKVYFQIRSLVDYGGSTYTGLVKAPKGVKVK